MALPTWMTRHAQPEPVPAAPTRRTRRTDTWQGQPLPDRTPTSPDNLHYRIYNAATRELLSFGTNGGPGSLNSVVQDALNVLAEHPGIRLYVEQFDGPAYT
ncbi:hypothetical protein [Streptomyces sp. NPDC058657]|uniref:hypothetical protein n=1 Tax=unclassified Streptomyces TaxID=2593676 RepID=UPI003663770A